MAHAGASISSTYYTVLGISTTATLEKIKEACKRLAIERHPDKNLADVAGATIAFQKVGFIENINPFISINLTRMFTQLQADYAILSDPVLCARYDITIRKPINKTAPKSTSQTATAAQPGNPTNSTTTKFTPQPFFFDWRNTKPARQKFTPEPSAAGEYHPKPTKTTQSFAFRSNDARSTAPQFNPGPTPTAQPFSFNINRSAPLSPPLQRNHSPFIETTQNQRHRS